ENLTSASEPAEAMAPSAARAARLARKSSIVLARQIVHVTTDATKSPTMTAFTTTSADTNIPHGERSRGSDAAPTTGAVAKSGVGACAEAAPARMIHAATPASTAAR